MSKKGLERAKSVMTSTVDPMECPFREFRDNELHIDTWGLGTAGFKAYLFTQTVKAASKADSGQRSGGTVQGGKPPPPASVLWFDEQTQPLPRSVRQYLHGWTRAEELAMDRYGAELTIFDDVEAGKMVIADMQLCHAQVLLRSSFCRKVLSACFLLERADLTVVEHQWELFTCAFAPEGWRPKYHIYSPGMKAGGGTQHRPGLSKNGCYLIRLFHLGTWRCVWVNDQVPVDTSGAPLLPFSPLLTHPPAKPGSTRIPPAVTAGVIYLWPLLLTKALLKLAAPDMNSDEDSEDVEDELLPHFNVMHALTGSLNVRYLIPELSDDLWTRITSEVPIFVWDDDEDASTVKTKSSKKPTAKELTTVKRAGAMTYAILIDTKDYPPYHLPGITPGHEMSLIITMARDIPIKKPLPEPEVALWKHYRWVDWARAHGLYEAYDCPRDKYLKVNGLLKTSHAPHLLDVQSTESITMCFIEEHVKSAPKDDDDDAAPKKKKKEPAKPAVQQTLVVSQQAKAELREWIQYQMMFPLLDCVQMLYQTYMFNNASAGSNPIIRFTKSGVAKMSEVQAPNYGPLYMQLDSHEINTLRMSFSVLHPRILSNCGSPVEEYIEAGHMVLEKFEWFKDTDLPVQKGFLATRGYEALEISLCPGRHFFRLWTHYRMSWHIMVISESSLLLNTRDVIQGAAVHECPWASKFLLNLGAAFSNWIKVSRVGVTPIMADREFFKSYLPDLPWDDAVVGYDRHLLHWMFRQALQSLLMKTMSPVDFKAASFVLRKYFCDPDFGFPPKPVPPRSLREIANLDICDCLMPELEAVEQIEEQLPEVQVDQDMAPGEQVAVEETPIVPPDVMEQLLKAPEPPVVSQTCELATSEVYCAILKEEREKMIRKHEAATVIQAYWRGTWVRQVLGANIVFTPEVTKSVMERAFGTQDVLSTLMNEFFLMWPGTIYAYSVASALSGVYGLVQHNGVTAVTPKCKWIPHFQAVFYCHANVKVHFDVLSTVSHSTVEVYNNDTGDQLPQVYNCHITFEFEPNFLGYTVLGHGTLAQVSGISYDAQWQLTVMTSLNNAFHICDNEDFCKELPLPSATKLHVDEIFLPNRRNILGGIQIAVTKYNAVSFRAAASSPDLEMVATLRTKVPGGGTKELGTCTGKGEIYWPFIRLESTAVKRPRLKSSGRDVPDLLFARNIGKSSPKIDKNKNRSASKFWLNMNDTKVYTIEVTCPKGWPLSLDQWTRVDEVRNSSVDTPLMMQIPKKGKEKERSPKSEKAGKGGVLKEKVEKTTQFTLPQPLPGDAYIELECASALGGGLAAKRDDDRDLEFAAERRLWANTEPGRNHRGAQIRKEFRAEFLVAPPQPPGPTPTDSESVRSGSTYNMNEAMYEDNLTDGPQEAIQRPTPVSETELGMEMEVEVEEEALYLTMPEILRDKFIPLDFVPVCTKEKTEEESVLVTADMAEAARQDRHARIEAAIERMIELQAYNEEHIIGRQRNRTKLLEKFFVDATIKPEILEVIDLKEEATNQEVNLRNMSALNKKKTDTKEKKTDTREKKTDTKRKRK